MANLSAFIRKHAEEILAEWEAFARTMPIAKSMDMTALRDHAQEMLKVIANDLDTAQTPLEQKHKGQGKSDASETGTPTTAAQEHGAGRAVSGFSMAEMFSELRALRASVIRLWVKLQPEDVLMNVEDMIRFNEAIDQAIAESVTQYADNVGTSKERFLAILGHDLRNPLGAIMMSSAFMLELGDLGEPHRNLVSRISNSAKRMNEMVSDLLDFARTSFGDAIPIEREDMDVTKMVADVVSEVAARYPDASVKVEADAGLRGQWDCARLTQALTNLVSNAVQHGSDQTPIMVSAHGQPEEVVISVHNQGRAIPDQEMRKLFKAGRRASDAGGTEHLGLGLFIVDRIVSAHGGRVDVTSTDSDGTTFTVRLPRAA